MGLLVKYASVGRLLIDRASAARTTYHASVAIQSRVESVIAGMQATLKVSPGDIDLQVSAFFATRTFVGLCGDEDRWQELLIWN